MNELIPIFPLNLVMYPGSVYPLHIFEERYKRMIQRCQLNDEGFGIVSKIDEEIAPVGCYVKLVEIINIYDNGSMDIIVKGIKRFRKKNHGMHPDGYLQSEVEDYIDQDSSISDLKTQETVLSKFQNILKKTKIELSQNFWNTLDNSNKKSFKIAEKSGLNIKQQQNLLNLQSEKKRIDFLLKHFTYLESYLDNNDVVKDIVMRDGYLN
ncbi:MAG: ATP-dependent protease [Melioribacteraceae bacterium]|nr:MAG: ATP-dependent protease [Melioribacteraceae bacterium]